MTPDLLKQLVADQAARRPVVLATNINTGAQAMIHTDDIADQGALEEPLQNAFRYDKSQVVAGPGGDIFLNVFNPPLRMVIVGAVHTAQALVPMAKIAGYDITVLDPRGAFATIERFPDVAVIAGWPDEALPGFGLDGRTALIALTHDPKIDDPALTAALASSCFYIGALGSKRTHAGRLERLRQHGLDDEALSRIHAPIGLDIGGRGPGEIAISIMAEVTAVLRHGSDRP